MARKAHYGEKHEWANENDQGLGFGLKLYQPREEGRKGQLTPATPKHGSKTKVYRVCFFKS